MPDVQIEEVELVAQPAMVVRRTVDVMRMGEAFADILPASGTTHHRRRPAANRNALRPLLPHGRNPTANSPPECR